MIPTTLSNSPSSAAGGIISFGNENNDRKNEFSSIMTGIASLVLEGRAMAYDDFQPSQQNRINSLNDTLSVVSNSSPSSCVLAVGSGNGCGGRQSPRPSTSKAASALSCGHSINITTNPNALISCGGVDTVILGSYNNISGPSSVRSAQQRLTQKLCQLRQASPSASLGWHLEQKVSVESPYSTGEPELVALAIHDGGDSCESRGEYKIVRRSLLNRSNAMNNSAASSSSPISGSENFLHSLQSLATTCLRGSNPSTAVDAGFRLFSSAVPVAGTSPKYTYRATTPRFQNPYSNLDIHGSASSSGSGVQSPKIWSPDDTSIAGNRNKDKYLRHTSNRVSIPATITSNALNSAYTTDTTTLAAAKPTKSINSSSSTYPQQGPHCDQFLRKMGLAKGEAAESEEHFCDMSYVNITCSRWRAYCHKMEAIITRGEALCIEVYLGPVNHKLLLEQWIINQNEKVPPPTMTLPSLCSAIRSQLYFSQISSWCDLINKSDHTIFESGRVIYPTPTCVAGDLATSSVTDSPSASVTPGSSPNSTTHSNQAKNNLTSRPRLNIFYRIKSYDSSGCFTSNPKVHNFPNVNISDNFSISVCLKSLPRINRGIPNIKTSIPMSVEDNTNELLTNSKLKSFTSTSGGCRHNKNIKKNDEGAKNSASDRSSLETPKTSRSGSGSSNCDNKMDRNGFNSAKGALNGKTEELSKNNSSQCLFYIDEKDLEFKDYDYDDEEDNSSDFANGITESSGRSSSTNMSHREKQLMKYRKRMLKRDKKHRKPSPSTTEVSIDLAAKEVHRRQRERTSTNCSQPMEQGEDEERETQAHIDKNVLLNIMNSSNRSSSNSASNKPIKMISTGTQTQTTCCQCGSEKQLLCLKCNAKYERVEADEMDSCSLSSCDIIHTPRSKADLLLQAIQRTPKAKKHKQQNHPSDTDCFSNQNSCSSFKSVNNNHLKTSNNSASTASSSSGCQECKRQKTQHNFNGHSDESIEAAENVPADEDDDGDGKAKDSSKTLSAEYTTNNDIHIMEEETFITSTTLTPYIDRCTIRSVSTALHTNCRTTEAEQTKTFHHVQTTKPNLLQIVPDYCNNQGAGDGCVIKNGFNNNVDAISPSTPKPLSFRKGLPKVNLTPIFCTSSSSTVSEKNHLSAPIPINRPLSDNSFSFDPAAMAYANMQPLLQTKSSSLTVNNNMSVQKSFSAPTLPHSPSLSPRFAKQAAIYKRRSRHLSDRSDRSSLGSDEQFSDEDLENYMYSPATSPIKMRTRLAAAFKLRPLLGSLEEALLQRRLLPKTEVFGFKLLLGASGGFCPTQLTLQASSYFYELKGESLSTPYVCEVRLSRKGYSVPRFGTVQATLLNPVGTVVRMFVIPYDMRDMPPWTQTFIRQRILADGGGADEITEHVNSNFMNNNDQKNNVNNNNNNYNNGSSNKDGCVGENKLGFFISDEQMKRLRYSIHLRFQTSKSGRLSLHTNLRLLISRRTDCDTAAAHAKGVLEAANDLITDTVMPNNPKYSARQDSSNKI